MNLDSLPKSSIGRSDPKMVTKIIAHPEFRKNRPFLKAFMVRSRELRGKPVELLYLQADMARELIGLQDSRRQLEESARQGQPTDSDEIAPHEATIGVRKQLAFVIRAVADGIAWRSLGYDRIKLRELADKPPTGHIELAPMLGEIGAAAKHIASTGDIVIMNDVTNFLRYGDFTSVGATRIVIHEVKSGRGSAKSGRATKQKQKAEAVFQFLKELERTVRGERQELLYLQTEPTCHVPQLSELIRGARKDGSADARLSEALAVEVFDMDIMSERFADDPGSLAKAIHNPFSQSKLAIVAHSLDSFEIFSPNKAPYSVFPLEDDDCIDIMTGKLWVFTYLNLRNVVRCLKRRGIGVRLPKEEELSKIPTLLPGQVREHELDVSITMWRGSGRPIFGVSVAELGRMTHELLNEESFADTVEERLDVLASAPEGTLVFSAFAREATLWN